MYTDTFEVQFNYSPITDYPSNPVPNSDVTQVSLNPPPEISSYFDKLGPKYQYFLHKFKFTFCQLASQERFNLIQLLCEIKDVYSEHKRGFGVVDRLFLITPKPDAELKKQRMTKLPIHYRDQIQQPILLFHQILIHFQFIPFLYSQRQIFFPNLDRLISFFSL